MQIEIIIIQWYKLFFEFAKIYFQSYAQKLISQIINT